MARSGLCPIRTSVLGMGKSATVFHIPFIQALPDLFVLHSIFERSATTEKSVADDRYGPGLKVVTSLHEVLIDRDCDLVVITTPNSTHYGYSKAALEAGKHVIVEKPFTTTTVEATELIQLASSRKLILAVYHNARWGSDFLTLRRLLETEQVFGDIVEFETRYDRWRPALVGNTWKELPGVGQGALFDLGSHLIDQVLTLFGTPAAVTGFVGNMRKLADPEFDDNFVAHFHYPVDAKRSLPLLVTLRGGILSLMSPQMRFTVKGTKASWQKFGFDVQETQLLQSPPMSTSDEDFGVEPKEAEGVLTTLDASGNATRSRTPTEKGDYKEWYRNVGQAIQAQDSTKLIVQSTQAYEVIRMIEQIYISSDEGRTVQIYRS